MSDRIKKLNGVLKQELAKIILKEIDLPRNILVTLLRVETAKDLSRSRVFISVIPENQTEQTLKILNKETHNLHQRLNHILFIRKVPKLIFLEEKTLREAQKIDKILSGTKEEN